MPCLQANGNVLARSGIGRLADASRGTLPSMRRPAIAAGLLAGASALCCATLELRTARTGDSHYSFLLLNLALAWLPVLFAGGAYLVRSHAPLVLPLAIGWLLFFP